MTSNEVLFNELQTEWVKSSSRTGKSKKELQVAAAQFFKLNKKNPNIIRSKITSLSWANKSESNSLARAFAKQFSKNENPTKSVSFESTKRVKQTELEATEPEPIESVHVNVSESSQECDIFEGQGKVSQTRTRKKPAQEKCTQEIHSLNSEIVYIRESCVQDERCRRKLMKLKLKKSEVESELRRLQSNEKASAKLRASDRIIKLQATSDPNSSSQPRRKIRCLPGRPRLEEDQPCLLKTIAEIAIQNGAADERRRTESISMCRTLYDLHESLKLQGFHLSRTPLYYRLLPANSHRIDGKRHVKTVPVKLVKAKNDFRKPHEDSHFAAATIKHLKDLANLMGPDVIAVISQDDKAKVPLGLAAATKQSPMLMHLEYKVRLPDHDWVVSGRHKLTPSVYAELEFNEGGELSYSGPTYIAVRSGKHDKSTADSHLTDFHKIMQLDSFKCIVENSVGAFKPVLIMLVDGGPDENPRFPKTLAAIISRFRQYNFDAIFCATYAPHHSAYNPVERRMAPLSRDLAGVILNHESCGKHLDSNGKTVDENLERQNFQNAGEALAEIWSESVIDGHATGSNGTDSEEWKAAHVRQSKYFLQVSKCDNVNCCWPKRSNIDHVLGGRFFTAPILFRRSRSGVFAADQSDLNKENFFGDLFKQRGLRNLAPVSTVFPILPYDFYCPSEFNNLASKYCSECYIYFPSTVAANNHTTVHRSDKSFARVVYPESSTQSDDTDTGCYIIQSIKDWLTPVFTED